MRCGQNSLLKTKPAQVSVLWVSQRTLSILSRTRPLLSNMILAEPTTTACPATCLSPRIESKRIDRVALRSDPDSSRRGPLIGYARVGRKMRPWQGPTSSIRIWLHGARCVGRRRQHHHRARSMNGLARSVEEILRHDIRLVQQERIKCQKFFAQGKGFRQNDALKFFAGKIFSVHSDTMPPQTDILSRSMLCRQRARTFWCGRFSLSETRQPTRPGVGRMGHGNGASVRANLVRAGWKVRLA